MLESKLPNKLMRTKTPPENKTQTTWAPENTTAGRAHGNKTAGRAPENKTAGTNLEDSQQAVLFFHASLMTTRECEALRRGSLPTSKVNSKICNLFNKIVELMWTWFLCSFSRGVKGISRGKKDADSAIGDFQVFLKTKLPRGPGARTQGESNPG